MARTDAALAIIFPVPNLWPRRNMDSKSSRKRGMAIQTVAGIGPLLAYTFKADKQEVTLSGRWFHEFDVKNRVRGDFSFKL
jgi:hypothetical protein